MFSGRLGLEDLGDRSPGADPRWHEGEPGHRHERPEDGGSEPGRRGQGPSVDSGLDSTDWSSRAV